MVNFLHPPNPGAPRRALSQARPQTSHNRRRGILHPPTPELPRQLVSRVRYVEDSVEPRTTLEAIFTILIRLVKTVIQLGRMRVKTGGVPSGYVEDWSEPRTTLEARFTVRLTEEGHDGQTDE